MTQREGEGLQSLGAKETRYPTAPDVSILETFSNKAPGRPYKVEFHTAEFTSLCPVTGQPDFATITIVYQPRELCVESKSLKLYLFAFRSFQGFMESITNKICDDLVALLSPRWIMVVGDFNARGGITTRVVAESGKEEAAEE